MKPYNNEKAIISLTSWRKRINTVGLTLFSLVKRCPGFHIVLVLSEEEFPKKEAELPDTVMAFVEQDLIEILWVYKNYKSFKKILFTMDKYKDVPVISADDDCIYTCNYAEELYNKLISCDNAVIVYSQIGNKSHYHTQGPCTIYDTKNLTEFVSKCLEKVKLGKVNLLLDDTLLSNMLSQLGIATNFVHENILDIPYKFHTTTGAINPCQYKTKLGKKALGIL